MLGKQTTKVTLMNSELNARIQTLNSNRNTGFNHDTIKVFLQLFTHNNSSTIRILTN
jgi:hypothetical protein